MEDVTHRVTETQEIQELTTPVSTDLSEPFLGLLTAHHATYERGEDCSEGWGTAYLYHIKFPPGTKRRYGMLLYSAQSFDIVFPDNYELHGIEQHTPEGTREILFLPRD